MTSSGAYPHFASVVQLFGETKIMKSAKPIGTYAQTAFGYVAKIIKILKPLGGYAHTAVEGSSEAGEAFQTACRACRSTGWTISAVGTPPRLRQ